MWESIKKIFLWGIIIMGVFGVIGAIINPAPYTPKPRERHEPPKMSLCDMMEAFRGEDYRRWRRSFYETTGRIPTCEDEHNYYEPYRNREEIWQHKRHTWK